MDANKEKDSGPQPFETDEFDWNVTPSARVNAYLGHFEEDRRNKRLCTTVNLLYRGSVPTIMISAQDAYDSVTGY
jgi:hypothetical protein